METSPILDVIRVGFAGLRVSPTIQEQALRNIEVWLTEPRFVVYRPQILSMIERARWDELLDGFYQTLPFGTGGRRGRVGIGPNGFNPWTLATSVQGHAEWLQHTRGEDGPTVVIGYDVRRFTDINNAFDASITMPIHGITSRNFAEIAAEIYAAHEITVYLPPEGSVLSIPELSFAVRALNADGGLVISASHNPPDDNGSKFYHHHGGQLVPPFDEEMGEWVSKAERIERMSLDRATANGLVRDIPSSVHEEYLDMNLTVSRTPEHRQTSIVFTSLHGTGRTTVAEVLQSAGFACTLEPTQADYDGTFPTVPFQAPNPEQPATLDIAIQTANQVGAQLVMACDPDADRLGVGVFHHGEWVILSGNEIAALVCIAALEHHPHPTPLILKTEVTSSLVSRIAEAKGAHVIDDLLVGFKYIGEALHLLERKGRYRGREGTIESFAVGLEESHGVLVHPEVRDKDAAGGALLLAELASKASVEGQTLVDTLENAMRLHGVVHNHTASTVMKGAIGRSQIDAIMASYRNQPPRHIGNLQVLRWFDRQDEAGPFGPISSNTDRASRNMLVYELEGNARILLRPSGTEPKAKIYAETSAAVSSTEEVSTVREEMAHVCKDLAHSFCIDMLKRIDVSLPTWAMEINDIVSVEDKSHWAHTIVPTLMDKVEADPIEAGEWLRSQLSPASISLLETGVQKLVETWDGNGARLLACFKP